MSSLFNQVNRNALFLMRIRQLSSFNNNRTKSGLISLINKEDLNIWSENNWSEFGKQFNVSSQFPLPGLIGICVPTTLIQQQQQQQQAKSISSLNKTTSKLERELLYTPLPHEHQMNKLNEIGFANWLENKLNSHKLLNMSVEIQAHKCPDLLAKDFQAYFQTQSIGDAPLTIITLSLKSDNDMATWSSKVENERELLIERFVEMAKTICLAFETEGFWADYIDPSSGQPFKSNLNHATFYETDERYRQLGFEIVDYGCCKVISHHKWGTKAYVGCMLTTANVDGKFVKDITKNFNAKQ